MDKTKSQRDHEEKLIVSAWYNMVRTLFCDQKLNTFFYVYNSSTPQKTAQV